jgi:hypothetical protein
MTMMGCLIPEFGSNFLVRIIDLQGLAILHYGLDCMQTNKLIDL